MNKTCSNCKAGKLISEFNRKGNGHQPWCRTCTRESSRNYYKNNGERHRQYMCGKSKLRREKIRDWMRAYKSTLACVKCGEDHPATIDFHHRDPTTKTAEVSWLYSQAAGVKTLLAEIKKCDPLCSNCHRKLHYDLGSDCGDVD